MSGWRSNGRKQVCVCVCVSVRASQSDSSTAPVSSDFDITAEPVLFNTLSEKNNTDIQ